MRVSTRKEEERGQSLPEQEARIRARVESDGDELVGLYFDVMSGRRNDRPEWNRLLADVEPGDIVMVTIKDRLGRDQVGRLTSRAALLAMGAEIVATDDLNILLAECRGF